MLALLMLDKNLLIDYGAVLKQQISGVNNALIAQLDRVSVYETGGCTFESCWAHVYPLEF